MKYSTGFQNTNLCAITQMDIQCRLAAYEQNRGLFVCGAAYIVNACLNIVTKTFGTQMYKRSDMILFYLTNRTGVVRSETH